MRTDLTHLFGLELSARTEASAVTESSPERLRTTVESARIILSTYKDTPQALFETSEGVVVVGDQYAVALWESGHVAIEALPELVDEALKSRNPSYGFHGTIKAELSDGDDADKRAHHVYSAASKHLQGQHPHWSPGQTRAVLDSVHGRYLADHVLSHAGQKPEGGHDHTRLAAAVPEALANVSHKWHRELDKTAAHYKKSPRSWYPKGVGESREVAVDRGSYVDNARGSHRCSNCHYGAPDDPGFVHCSMFAFRARANGACSEWAAKGSRHAVGHGVGETMDPELIENDEVEIVATESGYALRLNGETVAEAACDFDNPLACARARIKLLGEAFELGYVIEGTFDMNPSKGGKVVQGDPDDEWSEGEDYWTRRRRRRYADSATGKPAVPASYYEAYPGVPKGTLESVDPVSFDYACECIELVNAAIGEMFDQAQLEPERIEALSADFRTFERDIVEGRWEEALARADMLVEIFGGSEEYDNVVGPLIEAFRRSQHARAADDRVRHQHSRNGVNREERKTRARSSRMESVVFEAIDETGQPRPGKSVTAAHVKHKMDQGFTHAVWSTNKDVTFHKNRKDAEAEATKRPRGRDGMGRTWTSTSELHGALTGESVEEDDGYDMLDKGKSAADDSFKTAATDAPSQDTTFIAAVAGAFSANAGKTFTFAGMKASLQQSGYVGEGEELRDADLMRALSKLVNCGAVQYVRERGYCMEEQSDEDRLKLAQAAQRGGSTAVVVFGEGRTPAFFANAEAANEFRDALDDDLDPESVAIEDYVPVL